ncbi:MAG: outer membrane protein assembly factor BamD [Betaproteobacteria bacterium]|nr:outer membrane protein assembly factor BamD [Betaproteobacteria bacterium]
MAWQAEALAACGLGSDGPDPTSGWTAEKLYAEAKAELSAGNLAQATRLFGRLESRYPFGRYAQQAQLELAYGHYRLGEKEQALSTLDRFSKMYPTSPAMDYVFYLRGLVHFNDQMGLLVKLGGQSLADRDLKATRQAYDAFRVVLERYPDSAYVEDSRQRLRYLVNTMAEGELTIAKFYWTRGAHVAAANRAQQLIQQFPDTPAVEEALVVLILAARELGLSQQAEDAERVFKLNYPESRKLLSRLDNESRWWEFWR